MKAAEAAQREGERAMFGLGKIFDSVFGKFFDSIGMGWLGQAIALTADIMSGNWVGAAQDVFNLVAEFTDSAWMDRVASLQPLGAFDGHRELGHCRPEKTKAGSARRAPPAGIV